LSFAPGAQLSAAELSSLARGADELDLVNSGLEETMVVAYHEIVETRRRHPAMTGLRTAAFLSAIDKVARAYPGAWDIPVVSGLDSRN
jgi:glutamate dehydrogenase (NAD(P)+)